MVVAWPCLRRQAVSTCKTSEGLGRSCGFVQILQESMFASERPGCDCIQRDGGTGGSTRCAPTRTSKSWRPAWPLVVAPVAGNA